jgi:AbrB family looped-hinge helix DNA binding protein
VVLEPHIGELSMTLVRLRRAAQITLPQDIREAVRLKEGDYLEAEVTASGAILLKPVNIAHREPTLEQEAEILSVVDQERRAYAAERHR